MAQNNWAVHALREYRFWRDGMTPEEFDEEREYYYRNIESVKNGEYIPLWEQRLTKNDDTVGK